MYNNFLEVYHDYFSGLKVDTRYDTFPEPEEFFRIGGGVSFDSQEEKAKAFLVAALYVAKGSVFALSRSLTRIELLHSLAETTFNADFMMALEDYRVSNTPVRIIQLVERLSKKDWFVKLAEAQVVGDGKIGVTPAIMAAYLTLADYSIPLEKALIISGQQMGEVLRVVCNSISALSYSVLEQMAYGILVNSSSTVVSQSLKMNNDICLAAYLASDVAGDALLPVRFKRLPVWRDRADGIELVKEAVI